MAAFLVLNTTSLRDCQGVARDVLHSLFQSWLSLQALLPIWQNTSQVLSLCVPSDVYGTSIADRTGTIHDGLELLDRDEKRRFKQLLDRSVSRFDEFGCVAGAAAPQLAISHGRESRTSLSERPIDPPSTAALQLTFEHDEERDEAALWSADCEGWRDTPLAFDVENSSAEFSVQPIQNVWDAGTVRRHREWLTKAGVHILPDYEDPGHHDPTHPAYVRGKSWLPRFALRLLNASRKVSDRDTWWARCECHAFHRFQGTRAHGWPLVHWNGTTHPRARQVTSESEIPPAVRALLMQDRPVEDCGCRF